MKNLKEDKVILEADFEENDNKKNECDCENGETCNCGDDCQCHQHENKERKGFKSFHCESCKNVSGGRLFFGVFIFLLGIFYLGRTLNWWSFDLDWSMIWPILIIFFGLLILGGNRTVRWLLWVLFFVSIVSLITVVILMYKGDNKKQNGIDVQNFSINTSDISSGSVEVKNLEPENTEIQLNHYFSGSYTKQEVEQKMEDILNSVYSSQDNQSVEIRVNIDAK